MADSSDDGSKKAEGTPWVHGQEISLNGPRQGLLALKEAVEKAIALQKKDLQKYVAMRDSFK